METSSLFTNSLRVGPETVRLFVTSSKSDEDKLNDFSGRALCRSFSQNGSIDGKMPPFTKKEEMNENSLDYPCTLLGVCV